MHETPEILPAPWIEPDGSIAARIRALRTARRLSQAALARMIGVDQSNVSRWERGAIPDDGHIHKLAALAGVHPAAFRYGEIPPGQPARPEAARSTVPVVGYVGGGQEVFPLDDHALGAGLEDVEAPEGVGARPVVAVRIRGDSMHPMRDGWLLFYRRDQNGVPDDCLNKLCVVKLADDGPLLVKEVRRGYRPQCFVLSSWNAPPLEDVQIEWAALVLSIRPN